MSKDKRKYIDRRNYLIGAVAKRRKKIRQMAVAYKGGACEICGYSKCIEALDFHHLDLDEKDFGISSKGYTRSWESVKKELNKCIVICANCHREIHAQKIAALTGNRKMKNEVNSGKPKSLKDTVILSQALI